MEQTVSKSDNLLKPLLDLMNHNAEELSKRLDKQDDKLDTNISIANQALTQAKYTNGRVTKLEKKMADAQNKKVAKSFNIKPEVLYLLAVGAVITLFIVATLLGVKLPGSVT